MRKSIKLKAISLVFLLIFTTHSLASNLILPIPKPEVDRETKKITAQKKGIYPKKKPISHTQIEETVIQETQESKDEAVIFPQKKPAIYKTKKIDKAVGKSLILSQKDFKIAKSVFQSIDKRKWQKAIKLSKKARDKMLYNLVNYLYLIKPSNGATFYDYTTFINKNPNFPRINRLRYLAEHKINLRTNNPKFIIRWFGENEPLSEFGKIKLGEIYLSMGDVEKGSKLIKEGWIKAKLSKADLRYLRKKYKKIITVPDNIKRADWHAWEGKHWDVQRMLRYLPKDETALYRARQLLMSRSYGVDSAIAKVPAKYKNDIGLNYDRLKWRRRRGRLDPSLEILFKIPSDPKKLIRPDIWWKERAILTRSLIYKKKYAKAYKVSSNHSLSEGSEYAEAEWLSGWIALTFLKSPEYAINHFQNFYNNVGYPISLARGAYWLGESYEQLNDNETANKFFSEASKFPMTYYGQLAFNKINPGSRYTKIKGKPGIVSSFSLRQ